MVLLLLESEDLSPSFVVDEVLLVSVDLDLSVVLVEPVVEDLAEEEAPVEEVLVPVVPDEEVAGLAADVLDLAGADAAG